jgi:hypothetical protein
MTEPGQFGLAACLFFLVKLLGIYATSKKQWAKGKASISVKLGTINSWKVLSIDIPLYFYDLCAVIFSLVRPT